MGEVDSVVNDQLTIRSQGPDKTLGIMKTLHGDDLSILQCVQTRTRNPHDLQPAHVKRVEARAATGELSAMDT